MEKSSFEDENFSPFFTPWRIQSLLLSETRDQSLTPFSRMHFWLRHDKFGLKAISWKMGPLTNLFQKRFFVTDAKSTDFLHFFNLENTFFLNFKEKWRDYIFPD